MIPPRRDTRSLRGPRRKGRQVCRGQEERPFPGVCDPSRMVSIVLFLQSSGPQPCHTTQVRGGTVCACLYTLSVGTCTCGCALLRLITNRACLLGVLECVQRAAAQRSNYTVCDKTDRSKRRTHTRTVLRSLALVTQTRARGRARLRLSGTRTCCRGAGLLSPTSG